MMSIALILLAILGIAILIKIMIFFVKWLLISIGALIMMISVPFAIAVISILIYENRGLFL